MSEEKAGKPSDPFGQWVNFWDQWAKSWSSAMSETVASRSFADSMGQQMESSIESMGLLRRQVSGVMEHYLKQMSLPSRSEVIGMAERLTRVEMTLDDLDAKLDEVLQHLAALRAQE